MTRYPLSYANHGGFADTTLRLLVIGRLKSPAVSIVAALLTTLAWSAARTNVLTSSCPFILRLCSQIKRGARQGFVESRLRLFGNEASYIGSDLIAMTLLQQQKRVNCSAKKAVT
jgi:hypothetical protein